MVATTRHIYVTAVCFKSSASHMCNIVDYLYMCKLIIYQLLIHQLLLIIHYQLLLIIFICVLYVYK